ncbi:PREDICTED: uncharacterized protein LOC108970283 [Bactrocera latifrons]|uniref:uncharacterized protein LOC108970283 n=1 Tax=Bactrocera latifrons TaxID=174628 RepID=UPI0008DCACE5|nr:PREDICTED: uncharacterized protein LOC108970283 [Bactrocera latifrons]
MKLFLRKAISLFCVLCVITEIRGEYVSCMTPSGHKGNCIPLSGCPSLSRLANNARRTSEQTDYLQNSLCGPFSNNPFVCCPLQKPPPLRSIETLPEIESLCLTPNGKTGKCVLLKSCGVLLDLLRKTNLTKSQKSLLKNSKCGNANGKVLVCCPETESTTQTVHQKTVTTTAPQHDTAITAHPKTISKPTVHIAMSPMGNEPCRTPDHKLGVCIEIEKCPPLKKIILKDAITKTEYNLLMNSKCGEYGSPKICCSRQNDAPSAPAKMLTRNIVFPGSECSAANGMPGICKMSRDCPNANEFEQNDQCGYLGAGSQICCPINMLENDLNFPTTTQISRMTINTTPLAEVSCRTPVNKPGKCISIKRCSTLLEIVMKPGRMPIETMFLQQSQCGYDSGEYMVCCPETKSTTPTAPTIVTTQTTTTQTTTAPTIVTESSFTSTFAPYIEPPKENTNIWTNEPGCGTAPLQPRIYGGNAVHIDEYAWAARILYVDSDNNNDIFCGGSLINQNYVLTAAHCVVMPEEKDDWYVKGVRLGEWNTTAKKDCEYFSENYELCAPLPVDINIFEYIVHPMYNKKKFNYDIALLKLEESVTYTDFVKPICLPLLPADQQTAHYENMSVEVVGWGKTETGEHSEIKLKAHLKVKDINKCGLRRGATENQICAKGEIGTDSCNGDSGGPLMLWQETAYYLIGLISFGSGGQCGDVQTNGIYMRVVNFIDWIAANTQNS